MTKVIFISIFFLLACSSAHKKNYYFSMPQLKKIAQLSLIYPPPPRVSFMPVYVAESNDSIAETDFIKLQILYKDSYKSVYADFSDFLFAALNQKIKLEIKSEEKDFFFSQIFICGSSINRLYQDNGDKGILDKYCNYDGDHYTLKQDSLSLEEINTISYFLFINQLIRTDDDYNATINFRQLSSIIK